MAEKLFKWLTVPARAPETPAEYFSRLPRLETDRLMLRRMTMRDAHDMYRYASDPEVARQVLWDAHRSIWDTKAYLHYAIAQYHSGMPSSWAIVEKESGRMIGTIGFMSYTAEHALAEVGYSLSRACWNRGLMTEALGAVLREAFTSLQLYRVEAMHFTDNPASGRVMTHVGMQHEGTLRQRVYNKGRFVDVDLYAIVRSDVIRRP